MSTTVRDASYITKKNRDIALFAWKNQQTNSVNNGATNVVPEQASYQSGQVVSQRNVGCLACSQITSTPTSTEINYPFVGSGGGGPTGGAFPG